MFADIVIPKNNETEFVDLASKLGFKKLYFLYYFDEYNEEKSRKNLSLIKNNTNLNFEIGFIVNQKNINRALHQSKILAIKSSDKDRLFIESQKIKLIYALEELKKKDYLHQRASGLNHIICELAKKNNVTIGFSYSSLFDKDSVAASILIGRLVQNIRLCQKYKVRTIIGSFSEKPYNLRSPYEIISLFTLLGMNSKNIKESLTLNL